MRWLAALALVLGCSDTNGNLPDACVPSGGSNYFEQNLPANPNGYPLDLLLVIDDSPQASQLTNLEQSGLVLLMNALKTLPDGLPDLHLAVTTTSMGAGAFTNSVPGCGTPDDGAFVDQTRASTNPNCSQARISDGRHFIESLQNGTLNNFSGALEDVFTCLAQVGASGCPFIQPFAAARAALGDPMMNLPPAAGNDGFLRPGAKLAILFVTTADDCSVPADSLLFDPSQTMVSDPLGPLTTFRCAEFGILCNNMEPERMASGPYSNCAANDEGAQNDPHHFLSGAQFVLDYFQRIKGDPSDVVLAAIAPPSDPFSVVIDPQTVFPELAPSCSSSAGQTGDPAVRLKQVITTVDGAYTDICADSYAADMQTIASRIAASLTTCLDGAPADPTTGFMSSVQAAPGAVVAPNHVSCTVEDVEHIGTPNQRSAGQLPPCNPAGQPNGACWAILGDARCATGMRAVACRNGLDPTNVMKPCPDGPNQPPDDDTVVIRCVTVP